MSTNRYGAWLPLRLALFHPRDAERASNFVFGRVNPFTWVCPQAAKRLVAVNVAAGSIYARARVPVCLLSERRGSQIASRVSHEGKFIVCRFFARAKRKAGG